MTDSADQTNYARLKKAELVKALRDRDRRVLELERARAAYEEEEAALRQSDAWLRSIMENSNIEMCLKDREGRYLMINRASEEQFGVTCEEIAGMTPHDIFPKDAADAIWEHDQAVMESGQPVEEEIVAEFEEGSRTFLAFKFPIRDDGGEISGLAGVVTEITERKKDEVALLMAKEEAELANRAKSEFLANMSHELRTPLNAIIGFTEVLEKEAFGPESDPRYGEYLKDIKSSGTHLLDIITDLLDMSKIETGNIQPREQDVDVREVIGSCVRLVEERASVGGVRVVAEARDEQYPRLWADKRMVKQVLINLLSNAVKFTPAGGEVKITPEWSLEGGYLFEVSDTGIGIAKEDIPKAFTRFAQVQGDIRRKYEGSGLGLPLSKSLVELHGGWIEMRSEPGEGTTVTVGFPAERVIEPRRRSKPECGSTGTEG